MSGGHPLAPHVRCETCPYSDAPDRQSVAICRRHAPVSDAADIMAMPVLVPVRRSDWCGDHPAFGDVLRAWRQQQKRRPA